MKISEATALTYIMAGAVVLVLCIGFLLGRLTLVAQQTVPTPRTSGRNRPGRCSTTRRCRTRRTGSTSNVTPLHKEDTVALVPSNMSRQDAVLYLLEDYQWHDTAEINKYGGTEGTRRLRELRAQGFTVDKRQKPTQDGGASTQFQYRLVP